MNLDNLDKWGPFPKNLQNPNGRMMLTAAYLLKYHGYTYLADQLNELGKELIEIKPVITKEYK